MTNHTKIPEDTDQSEKKSIDIDSIADEISQNKTIITDDHQAKNDNDGVHKITPNSEFDQSIKLEFNENEKECEVEVENGFLEITPNLQFNYLTKNGLDKNEKVYEIEVKETSMGNLKPFKERNGIYDCEKIQHTNAEQKVFDSSNLKLDIDSEHKKASNLDKIHQKIIEIFPTVNLFKDINNDNFMEISKEEIYTRFTFIGIVVTTIMCLVPFWQIIDISIRTKSATVVTPIVPKEDNPYGEFLEHCKILISVEMAEIS